MIHQAIRFLLLTHILVIPILTCFFTTCVHAHSPHDVVEYVAISPGYEHDQTLFIYVFDELKRSTDGGHTWEILENGLDYPSALISDIATSASDITEYKVFAATNGDGIYRSNDRGDSWRPVNEGLANLDIRQLVLSPDFDNDQTLVAIPQGTGLFVSTDAGNSWQQIAHDKFSVTSVAVIKGGSTMQLLAGTDNGDVYLSAEGDDSWTKQGSIDGAGRITAMSIQVTDNSKKVVFVGTEFNGLYKTDDLGKSLAHIVMLPVSASNKETAYVTSVIASENALGTADVFVTTWHESAFVSADGGKNWRKLDTGLKKNKQADQYKIPHFYIITIPPGFARHGNAFIGGFSGLFKTADGGQSWNEMETRPARNIEGIAVSPFFSIDQMIALATYDGGAYVSRDSGKTWTTQNIGLPSTHLWDISIASEGKDGMTMYAISNPAFLTSKGTSSAWFSNKLATSKYWRHVTANFEADSVVTKVARRVLGNPGLAFPTQIAVSATFPSDKTLFLGTRYKGVLKSTDGGSTWSHPWAAGDGWISSLKISPDYSADRTVFASVREKGFYLSTDGGESWQSGNTGLSPLAVNYGQLGSSVIELSPDYAIDRSIYFGTADGLYLSADQGKKWERLKVTANRQSELIRAIGISPDFATDGMLLVSIKGRGLYKSTDRGKSFSAIAADLIRDHKVIKLFRFSPEHSSDHTIFAASAEEALVSRNSGINWVKLERPIRYEDTNSNIVYRGTWERIYNAAYSAQNSHRSNIPGDQAVFHFTGRQVTWYGPRSDEYGIAKVYLDGKLAGKVKQAGTVPGDVTPVFTINELPWGTHTLTIEVDNENNGNTSGRYIAIDALEVS